MRAEKQAAVDAEAYEDAGRIKAEIDAIEARLAELAGAEPSRAVGETEVADVIAARTGIPVGELVAGELERLQELEADLHERVIGQDEAVGVVADTIRRARVGLAEHDRPLGSFLFLGPTGVGKTELVKALSERLFASERALVRIDMSEYREPHTVARLIGSPPGYVGYGDGGQLTEPVRRRPYSVVLLDEIEKAHPEVWNVLLQLMDDGRLTDGEGRTVDFTNAVVVMTSNLGAGQARRGIGFTAAAPAAEDERMLAAAKSAFLPEFLNRIDEIVTFRAARRGAGGGDRGADLPAGRRAAGRAARDRADRRAGARRAAGARGLRRGVRRPPAAAARAAHAREGADPRDPRGRAARRRGRDGRRPRRRDRARARARAAPRARGLGVPLSPCRRAGRADAGRRTPDVVIMRRCG